MKFVDNGVPQDFARLTFEGMTVPLCELSEEEYREVVYGIGYDKYNGLAADDGVCVDYLWGLSIDELDLSVRASNCLRRANIHTIVELCSMTEYQLSRLRNMGTKTVKEIKYKLAKRGLRLRVEDDE